MEPCPPARRPPTHTHRVVLRGRSKPVRARPGVANARDLLQEESYTGTSLCAAPPRAPAPQPRPPCQRPPQPLPQRHRLAQHPHQRLHGGALAPRGGQQHARPARTRPRGGVVETEHERGRTVAHAQAEHGACAAHTRSRTTHAAPPTRGGARTRRGACKRLCARCACARHGSLATHGRGAAP